MPTQRAGRLPNDSGTPGKGPGRRKTALERMLQAQRDRDAQRDAARRRAAQKGK